MLGVSRSASDQEIKSAYRKLAMECHPDRNPGDAAAEEKFKQASEAYAVLADASKRAQYDRFGHAGLGGGAAGFDPAIFHDFSDLFGDFFGIGDMFGGGRRRGRAQRGNDIRHDITIQFAEAAFGATKNISVRRHEACSQCQGSGAAPGKSAVTCRTCDGHGQVRYQQGFFSIARTCPACQGVGKVIQEPCPKCKGEGRLMRERNIEVKIPAGVEDGTRIRYSGQGEAGLHNGPAGDLYVVIKVEEHQFFEREGKDLYCLIPISFTQAALGTELQVPTLDGEHRLKIPEGTQTGTSFRLRNKGMPVVSGAGKGDLFVEIRVETPKRLSKQQKEILQQLAGATAVENKPERRTLFSKVKDIFG